MGFNINTVRLKLIIFALFCGFGSFYPYLPLFYKKYLHFTSIQIGLLTSLYSIMAFTVGPLWSMLADRTKRPKLILSINSVITAVIALIIYTITPDAAEDSVFLMSRSFIRMFLLIATFSFFICPLTAIVDSIVLDELSRLKNPEATYGRQRFIGSIAYGFSAYSMALFITIEDDYADFGSTFIFYFVEVGILFLIFVNWPTEYSPRALWLKLRRLFLVSAINRPTREPGSEESLELLEQPSVDRDIADIEAEKSERKSTATASISQSTASNNENSVQQENRVTWRECSKLTTFWLLAAVQGMALAVINNYLFYALHQEFHISDTLMGIVSVCRILLEIPSFYWSNSAGTLILAIVGYFYPASKKQQNEISSTNDSAPPPQQLTNINGIRWVLVFSMFLLAIRVLLYVLLLVFRWNPYVTIVIDFSHGVIYAIFYSAAVQTVALSTPEHLRTSYQGIFAAMFSGIGPCLGSIVGGIMYEKVGAVTLFLSVFLLLITAIVTYTIDIVCCARREDSKHHKRNDAESGTVEKTVSIIASK